MKPLDTYITEQAQTATLRNLKVTFKAVRPTVFIQAPETFQEDGIEQYLDDAVLSKLPPNTEAGQRVLGKNNDNVTDAYFTYDDFKHLSEKVTPDIPWDSENSSTSVKNDVKLEFFSVTNLKYVLQFDTFELRGETKNIDYLIKKIFSSLNSNEYNKYPIKFKYDGCKYDI